MTAKEELELILKLIEKYNLPLSPILEYAIKEKIEECPAEEQTSVIAQEEPAKDVAVDKDNVVINDTPVDPLSDKLRIVEYGEGTIAVVGVTKPHKDALKSLGGYFVYRTQWGPAWVFRDKKRRVLQAYIDGDTSVITHDDEEKQDDLQKKKSSRYIIRVKYPNGRVFHSNVVWETLVDVVKYAGPENVAKLNILCMGDNLVSSRLNENPLYRSAQKEIGRGLYVCTYSSTETKYKQIVRINLDCKLGLEIEKIYLDEDGSLRNTSSKNTPESPTKNEIDYKEDKRIGYIVNLFPSQIRGEIVGVRKDASGTKKLVIKTIKGNIVEVKDLPYMYEIIRRN